MDLEQSAVAAAAPGEAVFGSRYPSLLYRMGATGRPIAFVNNEYRTQDPEEIRFLLRMCAAEARNRGVYVRALPPDWESAPPEPAACELAAEPCI